MLHVTNDWEDVQAAVLTRGTAAVYFTASWCVPCRQMKPQFARASTIDADRDYFIVDVDEVSPFSVVADFEIKSVPTIVFLDGEAETRIAARKAQEIVDEIANA